MLVERLGVADRQRVEILKVLYRGARTVILDEPTAVLVPQEVDELFATLREHARRGLHVPVHLAQARRGAGDRRLDHRDPPRHARVGTADPTTVTTRQLAEMMVGSELPSPGDARVHGHRPRGAARRPGLELAGEGGGRPLLDGVDLVVHAGEVLGIAGVEGNGQTELVETIMGMRRASGGTVALAGTRHHQGQHAGTAARPASATSPRTAPGTACCATQPLWANRILGYQSRPPVVPGGLLGLLDRAAARRDTERIVARVRRPHARRRRAGGRAVRRQPAEAGGRPGAVRRPGAADRRRTRPAGSTSARRPAIWDELRRARARGLAVLLISADLDELIGLSDTIKVMLRGRLVADADPATVTPEELGAAMTGADGPSATGRDDRLHRRAAASTDERRAARPVRLLPPALAIVFAALLCAVALLISGDSPLTALRVMVTQVGEGTTAVDIVNSGGDLLPRRRWRWPSASR